MAKKVSNYSRKLSYCARNGVWGWEVPEPKPWRKRAEDGSVSSFRLNRPCRYAADVSEKIAAQLKVQEEQARMRAAREPDLAHEEERGA